MELENAFLNENQAAQSIEDPGHECGTLARSERDANAPLVFHNKIELTVRYAVALRRSPNGS